MPIDQTDYTYQVSVSDFTQVTSRPLGVTEDAQIHPEVRPGKFTLGKKGKATIITDVDIAIGLVSNDCWMLSSQSCNSDLLKHEQGHYDIIAISAKELYNELLKLSAPNTNDLQKKVDALNARLQRLANQVDARYDTQTDHSRNTQQQQQWDKAIAAEKQKPNGSLTNLP